MSSNKSETFSNLRESFERPPKTKTPASLRLSDVTAIIDRREQEPLPLEPMRVESGTLDVGDYSVAGLESVVAIKRKTFPQLVSCFGRERVRFQRDLDDLRGWPISAVVIEASWQDIAIGTWISKRTSSQVQSLLASWIAEGHTIVMGENHATATKITRGILFHAARNRFREAAELADRIQDADKREADQR